MGRTNHSYNGMLSAIARKPLPRFTNYAKDTASLSTIFGNEYSTINKRGNDSLSNIISADFDTPEEYIKETNVGPIITLNGDRTVTTIAGEAYTDLGATADGGEEVTLDTSNLDTNAVGTYTVSYSATDTEDYTRVENRFVKVVAPAVWNPTYRTISVILTDKLVPSATYISRGRKYIFDFSQTRGKGFKLSLDGTTELTDGVIEAETTLVYTTPGDFSSNLYYYSPNTPNIGGEFDTPDPLIYGTIYFDSGILKAYQITELERGNTYTFSFSTGEQTTIALSNSLNGDNLTEGITSTPTSLTVVVPWDYLETIFLKSIDIPNIGSSLSVPFPSPEPTNIPTSVPPGLSAGYDETDYQVISGLYAYNDTRQFGSYTFDNRGATGLNSATIISYPDLIVQALPGDTITFTARVYRYFTSGLNYTLDMWYWFGSGGWTNFRSQPWVIQAGNTDVTGQLTIPSDKSGNFAIAVSYRYSSIAWNVRKYSLHVIDPN